MSHLSKASSSSSSDGLVVVDVNPAFVTSIASADIPITKKNGRKPAERHWSSKSARSRLVRQRFSEQPYYVPEPHSIIRRHSTEIWSVADSPSFGDVVKTAERLSSASCEGTALSIPSNKSAAPVAKVSAAVSADTLATCEDNLCQSASQLHLHNNSTISRSRSLGDLTQPPWLHPVQDTVVDTLDIALQNEVLIDRVERKLRNFHAGFSYEPRLPRTHVQRMTQMRDLTTGLGQEEPKEEVVFICNPNYNPSTLCIRLAVCSVCNQFIIDSVGCSGRRMHCSLTC